MFLCSTVWHTYEIEKGQNIKNFKRHSDGTFTSDFTHYLDKIKAKDFVEWLTSNSRTGGVERQVVEGVDYMEKCARQFLFWRTAIVCLTSIGCIGDKGLNRTS